MVDAFSNQFGNFMDELSKITATGAYDVAPKLKPVQPKTINIGGISLPSNYGGGVTGGDTLSKLMRAIGQQESSGNYGAYNGLYGASGKYQILKSNIPEWSQEALGHQVSYDQFMHSPQVQDAIARYKLGQYLSKYGAAGAAVAWYGGPGAVSNMYSHTTQAHGYPSLYAYWQSVLSKM